MQPYRHYHKLLEDQDAVSTIISVAELLRSEAEGEGDAKTSMNSFINMLKNAGLNINYEGLKAYYEADPRLRGQIQDFNEKEIVFVGDEEGIEMKTQGEVPPEEKVAQMAKSATDKRQNEAKDEGASQEEEDEFHRELDKLVHATFGHSSDEKKMYKEAHIDKYNDDDAVPKEKDLRAKSEPWERNVLADIAAGRDASWFLDRDNGAGQEWSTNTKVWWDVVNYQNKRKKMMNRLKRLAGLEEVAPPGREKQVKALKKKFDDPGAPYAIAWAQHNKSGKPKKKS